MTHGLPGWEDLYHSGLLLDAARLHTLAQDLPPPLDDYTEGQLRQRGSAVLDGSGDVSPFRRVRAGTRLRLRGRQGHMDPWRQRLARLEPSRGHRRIGEASPPLARPPRRNASRIPGRQQAPGPGAGAAAS